MTTKEKSYREIIRQVICPGCDEKIVLGVLYHGSKEPGIDLIKHSCGWDTTANYKEREA